MGITTRRVRIRQRTFAQISTSVGGTEASSAKNPPPLICNKKLVVVAGKFDKYDGMLRTTELAQVIKAFVAAIPIFTFSSPISATTIAWTTWEDFTLSAKPTGGSATGTADGITVGYSGELDHLLSNFPSYSPTSSWVGGVVSNVPSPSQLLQMSGSPSDNTFPLNSYSIKFSKPVTDPVIAIWHLGRVGTPAAVLFGPYARFDAGGPSSEFGGAAISVDGPIISGTDGNGSIDFPGTTTEIAWSSAPMQGEFSFTVGIPDANLPLPGVPEPRGLALLGTLVVTVPWLSRRGGRHGA